MKARNTGLIPTIVTTFFALLITLSGTASASIISVTGNAQILNSTPSNLAEGQQQSNLVLVFNEDQDVLIDSPIAADYDGSDEGSALNGFDTGLNVTGGNGMLSAGLYDSHLITFDPFGSGSSGSATFAFDGLIAAIFVSAERLFATDSLFNTTTTTFYQASQSIGRRSESHDWFSFNGNILSIVGLTANGRHTDQIRVITYASNIASTQSVAAPAMLLLISIGLAFARFRSRIFK